MSEVASTRSPARISLIPVRSERQRVTSSGYPRAAVTEVRWTGGTALMDTIELASTTYYGAAGASPVSVETVTLSGSLLFDTSNARIISDNNRNRQLDNYEVVYYGNASTYYYYLNGNYLPLSNPGVRFTATQSGGVTTFQFAGNLNVSGNTYVSAVGSNGLSIQVANDVTISSAAYFNFSATGRTSGAGGGTGGTGGLGGSGGDGGTGGNGGGNSGTTSDGGAGGSGADGFTGYYGKSGKDGAVGGYGGTGTSGDYGRAGSAGGSGVNSGGSGGAGGAYYYNAGSSVSGGTRGAAGDGKGGGAPGDFATGGTGTAGGSGGGSGSGSSGGGGGGGVPGTAAAAAGGGVPGTAAPPPTAPPAAGPAGRGPAGQTNNVFNNYSTGLGPAAVAAMIASSMTRYTRGAR